MNYIYLLPIGISLIIAFFYLVTNKIEEKKMIDKPFLNDLSNQLYILSYSAPFKWFINPDENNQRVKDVKRMIIDANESKRLNYRVYIVLQILTFMFGILLFLIFSMIANHSAVIVKFLFNIQMEIVDESSILKVKIVVGLILLSLTLIPSIYLKKKAKNNQFYFLKDLPILQLFIILMLKSRRPLMEVIYVLSTTNTIYKPIFETTYRMCVRDRKEGMEYLISAFENTKFEETAKVLAEYGEYSKEESMNVLENGLKNITEHTNTLKRRKDIGSNALSQVSLVIPFLGIILLVFAPIVYYGITLLSF